MKKFSKINRALAAKKKILTLIFALLTISVLNARVAFLVPAENTNELSLPYEDVDGKEQSPERRAWRWFNEEFVTPGNGQFICFNDLDNIPADVRAIWIYVDRINFPKDGNNSFDALFNDGIKAKLQAYVNNGGNLFLCKQATRLEKDLVGARKSDNTIIEPTYNCGGYKTDYNREDKWGMSVHFYDGDGWGSYLSHKMFSLIPNERKGNDRHIEMIWSDPLEHVVTNNNCLFEHSHMEMTGTTDATGLANFQSRNNCKVLGCWSNGNDCHCGGLIEFYPNGNRKGTVIMMGLAAYQWINNNNGWGILNIQDMTKGALEYLNARPCAGNNTTPMEEELAEEYFYPSNTTTFRTLHPVCEGLSAVYSLTSNPNNIARIEDVQEGGNTVKKLQFKAAGTVTLHIVLTENREFKAWPKGTYEYDREITFSYPYDSPRAFDNSAMAEKLADAYFYPANTTTFRTLHPVCEGIGATYTLTDPNNIARIQEDVQVGEATITQLQFQSAGTVTLRVTLTEEREYMYWPTGVYNYDREITFAYANANAAQDAVNQDFPGDGVTSEGEPATQMAMRLHPSVRGMDSLSYTITNHYDNTQGEAYKKTEDGVTRLYFSKSGKVLLTIRLNEPNWREEWTPGDKELERVIEFNFAQDAGPALTWPSVFETGAVDPNSVITLPETAEGLPVTYTVEGDASLEGNVLTLANVESGSVTVHASVTVSEYQTTWPIGTYNQEKTLSFHASEVGYLLPAAESIDHMAGWYDGEQPEYNAATWFQETYIATGKGRFVTINELPTLYAKGITTLWVNIERVGIGTDYGMFAEVQEGLKTYIQAGGNVLLTKQATRLAYLMERIGYAPEFNAGGYITENRDNIRSISTVMGTAGCVDERLDMSGHRIYNDMLSYFVGKNMFFVGPDCKKTYNYCSWQDFMRASNEDTHYNNCLIQRVRDFEQDWHATVFGIQGNIGDYCLSNIIEFNATGAWQGRILTIGSAAYQWGTSNNGVERENLKTLTANCLAYLANEDVPEEVYTRDIMNNMYGTICWGYDVEAGKIEGAEIYELTSFNAAGDGVILTEVTSMVGGRPYFFLGTSSQLRLTYQGQKKEAAHYHGLVGYIPLTGSDPYHVEVNAGKYILYYDKLMLVDSENVYVPVNRAYVDYSEIPAYDAGAPAGPRRRVVHIDRHQTPTGMEEVELPSKQGIYDIIGRKVANPQSAGFYIINGQKVVITH